MVASVSLVNRLLCSAALLTSSALASAGGHPVLTFPLVPSDATSIGNALLHTPNGWRLDAANGEIITMRAAVGGANTPYFYFIEVLPGTTQIVVDLFDADIGNGAANATDDATERALGLDGIGAGTNDGSANLNAWDTTVVYRLFDPSNTPVATLNGDVQGGPNNGQHAAWANLYTQAAPAPGHWRVEVDMTEGTNPGLAGTQNDANAFGLRAYETTPSTGDRELNVYYPTYANHGIKSNPNNLLRTFVEFPYISAGCDCSIDTYDSDDNATRTNDVQLISVAPDQNFTSGVLPISGQNVFENELFTNWARLPISPFFADSVSNNYGIWQMNLRIQAFGPINSNFSVTRVNRFNAVAGVGAVTAGNPVGANPRSDSFRVYLPNDANQAPVKPRMRQWAEIIGGSNPPVIGQNSTVRVNIQFINETDSPVAFSATDTLDSFVPGGDVLYAGSLAAPGSIISQPAIGGSGLVSLNPGTVNANTTIQASYLLSVTPTGPAVIPVTGTPAANGTVADFLDETGAQNYVFGPLCEVSVIAGSTLDVTMGDIYAQTASNGQVTVIWETLAESDNAGFHVFGLSADGQTSERLTATLIPAQGQVTSGAAYSFVDARPWTSGEATRGYLVQDVSLSGTTTLHGPVFATAPSGTSGVTGWTRY